MSSVRDLAYQDYLAGEQLKTIADRYGISDATVRSWKRRHWDKAADSATNCNAESRRNAEPLRKKAAKNAGKMYRDSAETRIDRAMRQSINDNEELTESQRDFCVYYIRNRNATQAYFKSHNCSYNTARTAGSEALTNPKIRAELTRLREIKNAALGSLTGEDIVEQFARIAFADMGDFADWHEGVALKQGGEVDGSLVTEVSETKSGVKIKLADKLKALTWLADYFGLTPNGRNNGEDESTSLIEAINTVWEERNNDKH